MLDKLIILCILFLSSCGASLAHAGDFNVNLDKTRTVYLDSQITIQSASELLPKFIELSASPKPVYLVINSPGGSVMAGEIILDGLYYLKQHNIPVRCLVTVGAFSMAFNIFAECSERYVFPNSKLMFHPIRISTGFGSMFTVRQLEELTESMKTTEKYYLTELPKTMGMDTELFLKHYHMETIWAARELIQYTKPGFLLIVNKVNGLTKFLK